MASSVKSRLDHYETLGVDPRASAEEISRAFAARMSSFSADPLGRAVQLCIAHETLRDPARRRDYDRALGLMSDAADDQHRSAFRLTQARWAPVTASAACSINEHSPTAAPVAPEHKEPVDPRLAAIAQSVRELAAAAESARARKADQQGKPGPQGARARGGAEIGVDELVEQIRLAGRAEKARLNAEAGPIAWRRPLVVLGGLVGGAAIFGAIAGMSLKGDEAPAEANATGHAVDHRAAAQRDSAAVAAPRSREAPGVRNGIAVSSADPMAPRRRRALIVEEQLEAHLPRARKTTGNIAPDQPPPEAGAAAASLPLPPALVARTIERIGYRCGEVASTSALEGQEGVFRVTCTSGNSYQATPVAGRYRFRRLPG